MIELLGLAWATSAAVSWEAQVEALQGHGRRWDAITIGALMPVVNTVVAVSYLVGKTKARMK